MSKSRENKRKQATRDAANKFRNARRDLGMTEISYLQAHKDDHKPIDYLIESLNDMRYQGALKESEQDVVFRIDNNMGHSIKPQNVFVIVNRKRISIKVPTIPAHGAFLLRQSKLDELIEAANL